MRPTTRAAVAVASLLALLAGLLAISASPASAGETPTMSVEKTVVGDGGGEFDFELGCETVDDVIVVPLSVVEFSLMDGDVETVTQFDLDTDFEDGVTCWVEELVAEGSIGVSILVTNEEGDVVAANSWDEEDLGEIVELEFQTEVDYIGSYYVDVYNFFATDIDLCAIGAEYLALADIDPATLSPEELEAVVTDIIGLLIEADTYGVPVEYQEALDTLLGVYFELNTILLSVDYDITLLDETQLAELIELGEIGEAAEDVLAVGLVEACEAPTPPTPTPTPDTRPANAVQARPAFTG